MDREDGITKDRGALAVRRAAHRWCLAGWDNSFADGCYRDAVYDVADPWYFNSLGAVVYAPRCAWHAEADFRLVLAFVWSQHHERVAA